MHTSFVTLFAAASLYGTIGLAAPTDAPSKGHISSVVDHLDSNNNIEWSTNKNGGRTATIPFDMVSSAEQNTGPRLAVRGPGAAVGGFTNIGKLNEYANNAASYACEQSGAYGVSDTIKTASTDACSTFLKTVPGAPVAEKAWNVYQAPAAAGPGKNQIVTTFRWFYNSAQAPSLTDTICKKAYEQLTSVFCQGKDDKGDDTRGGEIKIGDGDDYLMIGLDPNNA